MKYYYQETKHGFYLLIHSIKCDCGEEMEERENENVRGYGCSDFTVTHFLCRKCYNRARASTTISKENARDDPEIVILRECGKCELFFPLIHHNRKYCNDCRD